MQLCTKYYNFSRSLSFLPLKFLHYEIKYQILYCMKYFECSHSSIHASYLLTLKNMLKLLLILTINDLQINVI